MSVAVPRLSARWFGVTLHERPVDEGVIDAGERIRASLLLPQSAVVLKPHAGAGYCGGDLKPSGIPSAMASQKMRAASSGS